MRAGETLFFFSFFFSHCQTGRTPKHQMRAQIALFLFVCAVAVVASEPPGSSAMSSSSKAPSTHCYVRCTSGRLQQHDDDHDNHQLAGASTSTRSRDWCDCGVLVGCRCSDPMWDMELCRVDESAMEDEGMDDQGVRQHV